MINVGKTKKKLCDKY